MFAEHRELISQLKSSDQHFSRLFDEHNDLDKKLINLDAALVPATHVEVENLKKEKLLLKDQILVILKKAGA
ncbi:hypothetical protein HC248_01342 [Polaromonas vacuolata]|uniref:DUF465 domain-containing protein n=1 Tax=Polaromonas vacuolata TaxID=37448 RepID=A0A6H2H862_9BURK|nr:DUF465 domain-containing protein [Polaromonas vacuolata]QJC56058.1 hypothetical protein HC248_01342 [Polaromonas vacuolata]